MLAAEQRARVRMWRLADSMELGDRAGADRELAALQSEAEQLHQPYWSWIAATWAACHRFVTGDVDTAVAEASAATERLAGVEHPEATLASAMQVAIFEIHRGRGAEMVELWRMAVDVYPQIPSVTCGYAVGAGGERGARRSPTTTGPARCRRLRCDPAGRYVVRHDGCHRRDRLPGRRQDRPPAE